jgi:gamma-glutamyl:cysteine ligase YbdK (ATP-grasp superfamily)
VSAAAALPAFGGCGIELEYMIVDDGTLDVRAVADELLRSADGSWRNDVERGAFGWSNELAAHLVEVKNNDPRQPLESLQAGFAGEIAEINRRLGQLGARLMPGAMHPWMDPAREARLWPHEYAEVYHSYDRIFDCRRHGWANMQSMHVNLPFSGDTEFARLHAAIRLVLPILPALAASSPIAAGQPAGFLDYRVECYRDHAAAVPSMMGPVVPEPVATADEYRQRILEPMYRAIAPLDVEGVMQDEWLNARAAIARFDRSAIEIRAIDTQECPRADLAVAAATVAAVRSCYEGEAAARELAAPLDSRRLAAILEACSRGADETLVADADYLSRFGFPGARCPARELWQHLLEASLFADAAAAAPWREPLDLILAEGTLARRILKAVGADYRRRRLQEVYGRLCHCLARGTLFRA